MLVVDADVEAPLGARVDARPGDLVLLRLEGERVPPRALLQLRLAGGHEAAERVPVRDVLLVVELLEVEEVLPPLRLLLAAVVVEELREEPARLALLRAREERGADARGLGVALLGLLAPLALVRRRAPRDVRPALEEPAVELVGRDAVLAVVGLDPLEERLLAGLEVGLEVVDGLRAAADLGRPLEAEELLDLLQRVARHRGAQGLARDPVEVDEHLAAQEVVDLLLARRVLAHEAGERGALVGGVVVDVHAREAAAALDDVVDEGLERRALLVARRRAEGAVDGLPVLGELEPAGEELEPAARLEPRVALEVEPDVARGRLRQEREAAVVLERERRRSAARRCGGSGAGARPGSAAARRSPAACSARRGRAAPRRARSAS